MHSGVRGLEQFAQVGFVMARIRGDRKLGQDECFLRVCAHPAKSVGRYIVLSASWYACIRIVRGIQVFKLDGAAQIVVWGESKGP